MIPISILDLLLVVSVVVMIRVASEDGTGGGGGGGTGEEIVGAVLLMKPFVEFVLLVPTFVGASVPLLVGVGTAAGVVAGALVMGVVAHELDSMPSLYVSVQT